MTELLMVIATLCVSPQPSYMPRMAQEYQRKCAQKYVECMEKKKAATKDALVTCIKELKF